MTKILFSDTILYAPINSTPKSLHVDGGQFVKTPDNKKLYWRKNLQHLSILLGIWFVTSFLCSIVFVEQLDKSRFGGFRLGFYFAQQASIWIFVVLIFVYAWLMNRLDRKFQTNEKDAEDSE